MGSVFKARRRRDGRLVALKVIRSDMDKGQEHSLKTRFRRELNVSKTLAHPYVVRILDGGFLDDDEENAYIVMEYVDGKSLAEHYANGFDMGLFKRFFQQITEALAYIHDLGVIHRDIKPGNIVIDDNGRTVLVDFGLALSSELTRITETAERPGTATTMSPEQLSTGEIDGRSDIYSLGVTAYMYATGKPPYSFEEVFKIALGATPTPPPRLCELVPDFPRDWDCLIFKCMSLDRDQRYGSAAELLRAIERLEVGKEGDGQLDDESCVLSPVGQSNEDLSLIPEKSEFKGVFDLIGLFLCIFGLLVFYLDKSPAERHQPTVSEWSRDLADLRKELLSSETLLDEDSLVTIGELVSKAQLTSRLKLAEVQSSNVVGAYYLARYCTQQEQYLNAELFYEYILKNQSLSKTLKERVDNEYLCCRIRRAEKLLFPWRDKMPSTNRVAAAKNALTIVRPIVHHQPVVSEWLAACQAYSLALRYIESDEARSEAILFIDYCNLSSMDSEHRDIATRSVIGLLKAYRGFGIASKKKEHLYHAKRLTLELLKRKREPKERWGLICALVDIQSTLREHEEAEQALKNAVKEMPQFLHTAAYFRLKGSISVHRGDYKSGIATLEKALTLKLTSDERAYINRTLLEWRGYSSLLRK